VQIIKAILLVTASILLVMSVWTAVRLQPARGSCRPSSAMPNVQAQVRCCSGMRQEHVTDRARPALSSSRAF
jgi:hypothetical protein